MVSKPHDSMWAKTYGNSMDFLKTFSMEDFRKGIHVVFGADEM